MKFQTLSPLFVSSTSSLRIKFQINNWNLSFHFFKITLGTSNPRDIKMFYQKIKVSISTFIFFKTKRNTHTQFFFFYLKVVGDPKAHFSIATKLRCRGGWYSFSWIAPLTLDTDFIMLSVKQGGIKQHFWVFGITPPGIEPRFPGPLVNTLRTRPMGWL